MPNKSYRRPLNVVLRRGSPAERHYGSRLSRPEVIAPGIPPSPSHDLVFNGGKTIQSLHFYNFYVGGDAWQAGDVTNIDQSLSAAMSDQNLNNVMQQYFSGPITTTFDGSESLSGGAPATFTQGDVEALLANLAQQGKFTNRDLASTVFNFMLPSGTVLTDDATTSHQTTLSLDNEADSLHGLGGYHGSIHPQSGQTIYYAIGVYSETRADGTQNGIPVFDQPWKNVVATFYHELNEARTDANVEDAIRAGNDPSANSFLGWTSPQGEECGDYPVFESSNNLSLVFQEVLLTSRNGKVPVQFQYSNAVHGPEGPIAQPHSTQDQQPGQGL